MIGAVIHGWLQRPRARWSRLSPLIRLGYRLAFTAIVGFVVTFAVFATLNAWVQGANANAVAARIGSAGAIFAFAIALMTVPPFFQFAGTTLILVGQRRFLHRLRAERFTLCPGCGYSLRGSGRARQCPECGRRFDPKGVVREWGHILPRRGRRWELRLRTNRYPEVRR
ncbi:MAG: hypothetical protein K2Q20_00695 [Phycisphaerales bacterium]|nr:hypothetical protein [Phycisphaerales bacterium]